MHNPPSEKCAKCDIWTDYQVSLYSLQEAEELSHANWEEIRHMQDYIRLLEKALTDAGIENPKFI